METLGKLLSPLTSGTSAVQDTVVSTQYLKIYFVLTSVNTMYLAAETCRYWRNRRNRTESHQLRMVKFC